MKRFKIGGNSVKRCDAGSAVTVVAVWSLSRFDPAPRGCETRSPGQKSGRSSRAGGEKRDGDGEKV